MMPAQLLLVLAATARYSKFYRTMHNPKRPHSYADKPGASHGVASEGDYKALYVSQAVPIALAEAALPPGLSLAPQEYTPEGTHPFLFTFGNHSHVHTLPTKFFDTEYTEHIHMIPFVQMCDDEDRKVCHGPFVYNARLILDHHLPAAVGWMYGMTRERFAEYHSIIGRHGGEQEIKGLAVVDWKENDAWTGMKTMGWNQKHVNALIGMLVDQPMIWRQQLSGVWACAHLDWHLDSHASVAPADGTIKLHEEYGTPFHEGHQIRFKGVEKEVANLSTAKPSVGFVMKTHWRMSRAYECRRPDAFPNKALVQPMLFALAAAGMVIGILYYVFLLFLEHDAKRDAERKAFVAEMAYRKTV